MRWRLLAITVALAASVHADYSVYLNGDRVSIRADNTPLRTILEEFVRAGVRVEVDPEISARVNGSAMDMDVAEALEKILKPHGYAVLWDVIPGPLGKIERLSEIRVFRRDTPGRVEVIVPEDNFRVTRGPTGKGPEYLVDELLLSFKPGTDASEFHTLLAQIGGTVLAGSADFGVYRVRLPRNSNVEALVDSLRNNPLVARAEPNFALRLPVGGSTAQPLPPSTSRQKPERVDGVPPVAVLDSGLNDLSSLNNLVIDRFNAVAPGTDPGDRAGHGTQMALVAAGAVLPGGASDGFAGVPVVAIRAFDDNGITSNFTIMRALEHAIAQNARVINMSWGSNAPSEFLRDAIQIARSRGLIMVAAAGNDGTSQPVYPSAYPGVISVSALDADGSPWSGSNHGNSVSLAAPGTAEFPVGHKGPPGSYAGTSIASAYVARQLALYLAKNPEATAASARKALESALTPLDGDGRRYGIGKLDDAAMERLFGSAGK